LARAQGAPAGAVDALAACADRLDPRELSLRARAGGNPVIPLAEALRAAVGAEWAPYVHRGATSQDILDTALMLVAARTRTHVLGDLERTAASLARLAAEHRDTVMPGRTLTQHAVPTTFGLKAAGWRSLVLDARDRLAAVRLPAQLGGAAGTLAALGGAEALPPVAAYARELGLAEPALPWHTLRTPVADLGGALAFVCAALGKAAEDVLTLSRTEIGEVAEGSGGGSSAMPHKANPVRATLAAAAARQAPSHLAVLLGAVPAADERPPGAWHAEWPALRELLRLAGGSAAHLAQLAERLRVFPDRMAENLGLTGGLIVSERFSAVLGPREAKRLIERALADGVPFAEAAVAAGHGDLLDPAGWTGAAGALVDRALERS
ncbi:lyase family protein, partial [Streptomyces fuscigenes]|uniref:lyase family protein n=1 Tax=Streptomyces fuscigenes TaxID=1528880 RepID=UPI001EFF0910